MSLIKLSDRKFILDYQRAVRNLHQYIKVNDTTFPLISSKSIYIEPFLTQNYIAPQIDPSHRVLDLIKLSSLFSPKYQKIFIIGDPGMGKSTLVERIATILSRLESADMGELGRGMVPFPIMLSKLENKNVTDWNSLLEAYFEEPHLKHLDYLKNKELIDQLFRSGQAFVLMDGLDEIISSQQRLNLIHTIRDGLDKFPKGYWWFTTRILGFDQNDFLSNHPNSERSSLFPELYLAPFSRDQIQRFIGKWINIYERREALRNQQIQNFLESLEEHNNLQQLARIPNLLKMMALLFYNEGSFPNGRIKLYHSVAELYLNKEHRTKDLHDLSYYEQNQCIAKLAYEMQLQREADNENTYFAISQEQAIQIFHNRLMQLKKGRDIGSNDIKSRVEAFFKSLGKRTEILVLKAVGAWGFLHLSFQEYFAAEYLHEIRNQLFRKKSIERSNSLDIRLSIETWEDFWNLLREKVQYQSWRETLELFFEGFKRDEVEDYEGFIEAFEKIFSWDRNSYKLDIEAELVAAKIMCNEYIGNFFEEKERLKTLDHIFTRNGFIRESYDIGGSEAYNFLKLWGRKVKWYANTLKYDSNEALKLRWLEGGNTFLKSMKGLENSKNLTFLSLVNNIEISKIEGLRGLNNLKQVYLSNNKITTIEGLEDLTELQNLDLNNNQIEEIQNLEHLVHLQILSLRNNHISEIKGLRRLIRLSILYLDENYIADLQGLEELSQLKILSLSRNKIQRINGLANLAELKVLYLDNNLIRKVEGIKSY